jgi:hypothetical protein
MELATMVNIELIIVLSRVMAARHTQALFGQRGTFFHWAMFVWHSLCQTG